MDNGTDGSTEEIPVHCNASGMHSFVFTLIPVVYGLNFVVGLVGNVMAVAIIYCYMKLKTVANIFMLNLAVSDLTFLLTLPMWAAVTANGYHWPFGGVLCKATAGLVIFNLYTSVFLLTALSVDRYLALVHPVRSRQRRTLVNARLVCVLVWLLAFLLSVPTALTRDLFHIKGSNMTVCAALHRTEQLSYTLLFINLSKSVLGFLIPLVVIVTCYCLIGRALLGARQLQKSKAGRDEVLRMLAAVVLAFFLCWVPHQVFHMMDTLVVLKVIQDCRLVDLIDTAMPFTICVAFLNSCVNPVLYGFVGRQFRCNLLRLLRCAPPGRDIPLVVSHPSLSTKMSVLSCRPSETVQLATQKSNSFPSVK